MLMATKTARIEIYDCEVSFINDEFKINVKVTKIDKSELLSVKTPGYENLVNGVAIDDRDTKEELPIYFVLRMENTRG